MDQPNTKKSKNWLYRLRHLQIRNRNTNEHVEIRPKTKALEGETKCNSFRKSLKKMHTRMRSWQKTKSNNQRHSIHAVEPVASSTYEETCQLNTELPVVNDAEASSDDYATVETNNLIVPRQSSPPVLQIIDDDRLSPLHVNPNNVTGIRIPTDEITSLSSTCYWYWGPLTRHEAECRLRGCPDGAFLIRDSTSTSYLFTISFRSVGNTLHSRIEYNRGRYSLFDLEGYETITELIDTAMKVSENGIYCYTRNRNHPNFPVRLTKPLSRYVHVRSLKYLCRFVIKQYTNINDIPNLPLPSSVKSYLQEEGPYF